MERIPLLLTVCVISMIKKRGCTKKQFFFFFFWKNHKAKEKRKKSDKSLAIMFFGLVAP